MGGPVGLNVMANPPLQFGPTEFGQQLRRLRHERSLTQEILAEAAGISPRYVSLIEAGQRNPTLIVILELAAALGVSPARLFKI